MSTLWGYGHICLTGILILHQHMIDFCKNICLCWALAIHLEICIVLLLVSIIYIRFWWNLDFMNAIMFEWFSGGLSLSLLLCLDNSCDSQPHFIPNYVFKPATNKLCFDVCLWVSPCHVMFSQLYRMESQYNRLVSQMRATLMASCEPAEEVMTTVQCVICFWTKNTMSFNPCSVYPHCDILTHR